MVLSVVLSQTHSGLADFVTQLTGMLQVQMGLYMAHKTLLVLGYLSTVGALPGPIIASPGQRFQQLEEV